ncbi:MAG TPA: 5-oxoprolinase subunit PxpB [Candidatus Polarisedimenticolaceae bacterium]|nr:5-oxoprolinase subunit PxpB [Candidatus Polarisedimenticolaceae bacterium]
MRIVRASDQAFLVEIDDGIGAVHRLLASLRERPVPGQVDLHPAYGSVLVRFDAVRTDPDDVASSLAGRDGNPGAPADEPRTFTVTVVYDGPDLERVAEICGLSAAEVVRLHAGATYEVAFLGFSPGFPYLVGLPSSLTTPRLPSPRRRVPAGSVAIAGVQAGIYPVATAGGWNLIGRTDVSLFDAAASEPATLRAGDRVRFVPAP